MVYNNDGRSINKEKPSAEDFMGGDKCELDTHISSQHIVSNLKISFN